jgi:hypothetical protein
MITVWAQRREELLIRLYYSAVYLCHIESICYVGPMDSGST